MKETHVTDEKGDPCDHRADAIEYLRDAADAPAGSGVERYYLSVASTWALVALVDTGREQNQMLREQLALSREADGAAHRSVDLQAEMQNVMRTTADEVTADSAAATGRGRDGQLMISWPPDEAAMDRVTRALYRRFTTNRIAEYDDVDDKGAWIAVAYMVIHAIEGGEA